MWSYLKDLRERPKTFLTFWGMRLLMILGLGLLYYHYYRLTDDGVLVHAGAALSNYHLGYKIEFTGYLIIIPVLIAFIYAKTRVKPEEKTSQKSTSVPFWFYTAIIAIIVIWYGRYVAVYMRKCTTDEQYVKYVFMTWIKMMLMGFALTGIFYLPNDEKEKKNRKRMDIPWYPEREDILQYGSLWNMVLKNSYEAMSVSKDTAVLLTNDQVKETLTAIGSNAAADLLLKDVNMINDLRYTRAFTPDQRAALEYGAFRGHVSRMSDSELKAVLNNPASPTIEYLAKAEASRRRGMVVG